MHWDVSAFDVSVCGCSGAWVHWGVSTFGALVHRRTVVYVHLVHHRTAFSASVD